MWNFFRPRKRVNDPNRNNVAIRLEAIGGQGAHSAGKILAEAAVLGMKFTGNHFSTFGSEKRGSPVRSNIRFSTIRSPVRSTSTVETPDLLVVFQENLIENFPEVLQGMGPSTDLILNSQRDPNNISLPRNSTVRRLATVPAAKIASKSGCGLNAPLLGAMSAFLPEIDSSRIEAVLSSFFLARGPSISKANLAGFDRGARDLKLGFFDPSSASAQPVHASPQIGWETAPLGGAIVEPGNTFLKDHSSSRTGTAPRFVKELCFNCGYCDMVCPDYCFVWSQSGPSTEPVLKGIDYQYCKGCQKCVTVCPVNALVPVPEETLSLEDKSVRLFPGLPTQSATLTHHQALETSKLNGNSEDPSES